MRVCACGCGTSLDGRDERALYDSPACRARHWRAQHVKTPQRARQVRTNAQNAKPSGLQIPFRRACAAIAGRYGDDAETVEAFLTGLLSDRQRQQLEDRHAT